MQLVEMLPTLKAGRQKELGAEADVTRLCVQGPEQLFETVSQCLLSGMDRDALSGWGAVVYVM